MFVLMMTIFNTISSLYTLLDREFFLNIDWAVAIWIEAKKSEDFSVNIVVVMDEGFMLEYETFTKKVDFCFASC